MIRRYVIGYMSALLMLVGVMAVVPPQSALAAPNCNDARFLTFPAWYRGLVKPGDCSIKNPADVGGLSNFIWKVVLNVLEILLQSVVYIAAGFIIWGGFMYLISAGQSDRITTARKMIQNAVVGLIISLFAVFAISFIAGTLG